MRKKLFNFNVFYSKRYKTFAINCIKKNESENYQLLENRRRRS